MRSPNKKKILITGAAGFVGANLTRSLLAKNFEVHALIKKESNLWRISDLKGRLNLHYNDLSNLAELKKTLRIINPGYIFHLASHGSYPSQTNVNEMIGSNILGICNLLEASRDIPYWCFINTGSSSEYGFKDKPMKETDVLEPASLYAATKAAATLLCQVYAGQFNKPIISFRLFSVYGPYEEPTRLIPQAIKAATTGQTLRLTPGKERRDFIYVEDVVHAFFCAISKQGLGGEIFNIGTGKQYTNLQVANIIRKSSQNKLKIEIGTYEPRYWDTNFWVADISKTKALLNWQPKYNLEEGLKKTYLWFGENLSLYNQ
ncbi:hypothetical protein A2Z23_03300 [Candidatus Curtissbacteria bacterium RBG_16_39_7]|uniref:NAD-dependent epimerase/dehydratase domain-containing protein n=1 Tax=Candidatus Curtissbacteria bacterium RBG_16_39_7 TaxID=1797707 RepID=A0A1F5G4P5_9BACT|nr:MAG: hypothetical protein A2Z23_03300 [Candidatus Curtissbacteria bacterium RBG_16_39_7]